MSTIFASFIDADAAERAAGALLDQGADRADISIVANPDSTIARRHSTTYDAASAESDAKEGLSTTTPGDVAVGAVKGATVGAGLGFVAALAAMFVPGVGLVLGGGALATALAAAMGATAAGVAAGGVVGYLKDQGVSEEYVTRYSDTLYAGGAVLAISTPTGTLSGPEVEGVLAKYGAVNVGTFYAQQQLASTPTVSVGDLAAQTVPAAIPIQSTPAIESRETQVVTPDIPPIVGQSPVVEQTVVRQEVPAVPQPQGRQVVVSQSAITNDPLAPSTTVVVDPATGVRRSVTIDPVSGLQTSAVIDPITGEAIPSTVVTVQTQGANATEHQSVTGAVPGVPVVNAPGIEGPAVIDAPVVQHATVYDEDGNPIDAAPVIEERKVVVDPGQAKLL